MTRLPPNKIVPNLRHGLLVGLTMVCAMAVTAAQPRLPVATVTTLAERADVRAGRAVRLAAQVALPEGLHVQSNTPRDASLIPTVLTIDVPAGVTVSSTVYPPQTDLSQAGQAIPLAVYGDAFAIGAEVTLAEGLPAGVVTIPGRLRYQACDERTCFPPTTAKFTWSVRVIAAGEPSPLLHQDVFKRITFAGARPK